MSAPVVDIPPDPLRLAAGVLRRTGEDLIARGRHLESETRSTRLNRADPGFDPGFLSGRVSTVRWRLGEAAAEAFVDVECASRTVAEALVADAVGSGGGAGGGGAGLAGGGRAGGVEFEAVPGIDAGRGSAVVGPDVPLNPIWYLEQLGQLATELDQRLQFSAGACVGVCLNAAFQDGVLTTSAGAGLAYSVGADVTVKPIMTEEERTMRWEEHKIFVATPLAGYDVTKRVNADGTTEQWSPGMSAGWSPLALGGGWMYQWNRRDELWEKDDD